MTPGPPPLPIEVKRRRGTLRPDRIGGGGRNIAPVLPIDREAALTLTPVEALKGVLDHAPWLAESDLAMVVLLRDALEFLAELRDDPRAKPADVIAAGKWVHSMAGSLGLTPADRSKLGLAEVRAESKMDELRRRAEAKHSRGDPA